MMERLWKRLGRGDKPLRIAYGRIFHEANTYSPVLTTRDDFERMHLIRGHVLAQATTLGGTELKSFMPHAELTGFVQAAKAAGNVTTIPLISALAVPGGPLTPECFEGLVGDLLEALEAAGPVDGVYLALHGSMEVKDLGEPPEAVILRRVRQLVGPDVRMAVSYDLHANLSAGLVDPVDVLIAYRTNPHWDLAPTGFRAGNRLIRTLRGQVHPVHAWRKLPLLLGGGVTIDFLSPMRSVFQAMRQFEDDPRVLSASLFMVHPYTNAEDLGWAVHVSTDGDEGLARELADMLADKAWAERHASVPPMRSVEEALDEVGSSLWRKLGPVTLVDIDDIVGAGAPGGNTHIVEALVRNDRGLRVLVPLHDPEAVEMAWGVANGERIALVLKGTPGYGQPEVPVEARVMSKRIGDSGRTMLLGIGSFQVAISERPPLPIHPSFWQDLGTSPRDADAIVQKNFFHYRMFYLTTSFQHIPVVSAGATSFKRILAGQYRVPVHPVAKIEDWRASDPILRKPREMLHEIRP